MIRILLTALLLVNGLLYIFNTQSVQPVVASNITPIPGTLVIENITPFDNPVTIEPPKENAPLTELMIVNTNEIFKHSSLDEFCLAKNIYHEARGEDLLGQLAVAQVTLNRVESKRYPNDVCHVVMQRKQFSWANRSANRWSHPKGKAWSHAKQLAEQFLNGGVRIQGLETALYYHAEWVDPNWKDPKALVAKIGTHIFYDKAKPL